MSLSMKRADDMSAKPKSTVDILKALMPEGGQWEVARTDDVMNVEENPDFKLPTPEMEAAMDAYIRSVNSDDCIDQSGAEPIYLGDLTYLLQRRRLDKFGRTHTFVSLVPEGLLVEKAAAQFLKAEIIQAPDCDGRRREHTLFSKRMRALVRTPENYVLHAEPKWTKDFYTQTKNLSNKGGQTVRFYSVTVAYVLRWGRLRTSILVSKSRSLPPCHVYSFDTEQIRRLAGEYDARVAAK